MRIRMDEWQCVCVCEMRVQTGEESMSTVTYVLQENRLMGLVQYLQELQHVIILLLRL